MLTIAVLDDYAARIERIAAWQRLRMVASITFFQDNIRVQDGLIERLAPFDVVVVDRERTPFTREVLRALPRLRLLVSTGPVNWSIDYAAAEELGVTICCTEAQFDATPQFTWALILAAARRVVWDDRAVRDGAWQDDFGISLTGKTLGLIGLGNVGEKVARIAPAFGMHVLAWSHNLTDERARSAGVTPVALPELLRQSDIVSLHVVLSERTRHLIGAAEFEMMKLSAILVNTSRGPVIDEAAMVAALKTHRIASAALDVFDVEPLPGDSPLRTLDNVILTPHVGYLTREQYEQFFDQVVENIEAFVQGSPIRLLGRPRNTGVRAA